MLRARRLSRGRAIFIVNSIYQYRFCTFGLQFGEVFCLSWSLARTATT